MLRDTEWFLEEHMLLGDVFFMDIPVYFSHIPQLQQLCSGGTGLACVQSRPISQRRFKPCTVEQFNGHKARMGENYTFNTLTGSVFSSQTVTNCC